MKEWLKLSAKNRKMLLLYKRILEAGENSSDEALRLTKYCLLNDICISMIPVKKLYDETYQKNSLGLSNFLFGFV